MPLINGCKYSCEPCIRGHRATSCKHTDRVLVEVRKPGRPLQSCGHKLDTCSCGRLADAFSLGGGIAQRLSERNESQMFAVALARKPTSKPKPKTRVAGKGRVRKTRASETPSSRISQSAVPLPYENPIELEGKSVCKMPDHQWQRIPQQQEPIVESATEPPNMDGTSPGLINEPLGAASSALLPSLTPLLGAVRIELQGNRENLQDETVELYVSTHSKIEYSPSLDYASRVEDISVMANGDSNLPQQRESYIRTRYISTTDHKISYGTQGNGLR